MERPRTWWENSGVSYTALSILLKILMIIPGLAPLSETNRDRAAQLEMIKSLQR